MPFVGHALHEAGSLVLRSGVEVYLLVDRVCLACGHAPCPCCNGWCDVLVDARTVDEHDGEDYYDPDLCCGGECMYAAEPVFHGRDGFPVDLDALDLPPRYGGPSLRLPWFRKPSFYEGVGVHFAVVT